MKYKMHFVATLLLFLAIIFIGLFLINQPLSYVGNQVSGQTINYVRPVNVDVCNIMTAQGWSGSYQSQNCSNMVNHDANYYYYATVNNATGMYVPYIR